MIGQDLKHAVRTLLAKPVFTAATLLTLALGIGGNAAIFGVVNAVLLRPLPYPQPDALVQVFKTTVQRPDRIGGATTPPDFTDWRRDNGVFTELSAFVEGSYALTGIGAAEQVPGADVTGGFFAVLGRQAALGRVIATDDDPVGGRDVVVLSDALWTRRFGADRAIIGRSLQVDGVTREVVGVMPAGFAFPLQSELWVPLRFSARDLQTQRGAHYLDVLGRLNPACRSTTPAATCAGSRPPWRWRFPPRTAIPRRRSPGFATRWPASRGRPSWSCWAPSAWCCSSSA